MYSMSLRIARIGFNCSLTQFADLKLMPIRTLFTREELGVTQFERHRQNAHADYIIPEQIEEYKQRFVKEFENMRLDEMRNNLKQYILLIDGKPDEFNTLKSLLTDYYKTYNNSVHHVSDFVFGTPIMRLLYFLNLPDEAVKLFNDPDMRSVFEQMQTYKVLLTLLYDNKRYAEVFELYKQIRTRLDLFELFPDITINCLAFAACYQLNTPEHFQYADELWKQAQNVKQLSRSRYLLAGLAIKQNSPKYALGLVRSPFPYATVRFLRLAAFTQLGYYDKAIDILQQSVANFKLNSTSTKPSFGKQMVEDLRKAIEKSGRKKDLSDFQKIHEELTSLSLLSDETLDERLCATFPPMLPKNLYQKMKNKTFKANN
ncbi:pentatricopeptide repeat-containing protein 2, mitochondrial-like [Sitodiplosis mosellana]|uniref:pentatricopeptide repeat-containing protein 2, mitochondrial-like n=1 Tax=Sitodiplosis mosellana TaxID=263140 RepID=UPI002444F02C|nr:pentatricopeptide repeat-containing protein 2, mitochondrial-like [Sitodiplosis mosellana]